MRIVHTGRVYSGVRTPVTVLQALAKAHARAPLTGALELIFIGPHIREFEREAAALGIASLVQFLDRMPPAEAATFASDADVLLVIDAPSSGPSAFLPSKLVDYLPFRKPILGVTPEVGASATLLRRLGCRVVPTDRVEAIACAFEELVHEWRSGRLAVSESFARIAAEYDIVRTSSQLSDVLHATFDA
jgi:glycosyltransferase involved in cell wall biosynthesis